MENQSRKNWKNTIYRINMNEPFTVQPGKIKIRTGARTGRSELTWLLPFWGRSLETPRNSVLVGGIPTLWKVWVRQLELLFPIYSIYGEIKHVPNQATSIYVFMIHSIRDRISQSDSEIHGDSPKNRIMKLSWWKAQPGRRFSAAAQTDVLCLLGNIHL